jgi:hypothetical protein
MNTAIRRMIGIGIPISQSKAPLPKPMVLSSFCVQLPIQFTGDKTVPRFACAQFWPLRGGHAGDPSQDQAIENTSGYVAGIVRILRGDVFFGDEIHSVP